MKTLKNLTAAVLVALSVSVSAFAADGTSAKKLNMDYTVGTYIDAITKGEIAPLAEVLDKDINFTSTRGDKIVSHNREQVLNALKAAKHVKQNCSAEASIISSTPTQSIVKVTMQYDGFAKVEYLNLSNTANGWKITSVSTSFI